MRVTRLKDGNKKGDPEEKIERFVNGIWQTYYPPELLLSVKELHLNHALAFDHIAFISNEEKVLSIYSRKGELLYRTNQDGELEQMGEEKKEEEKKGTGFIFSKTAIPPSLLTFEDPEAISVFEHPDGSKKIYLPRYSDKAIFSWDKKRQRFSYCPNPSYYLNPARKLSTWGMNHTLNLISDRGHQAVAVPFGNSALRSF